MMFFSFDGIDGTGKSTQMALFVEWLRGLGHDVVECRDPGGTPLGEKLRGILLHKFDTPICRRAEMLLYMASRAQLVEQVIRPSLDVGKTVVSDRYLLANVAYQGYTGEVDADDVWQVGEVAVEDVKPTTVFLLDMPVEDAIRRLNRVHDRMEAQGRDFMEKVRQGFLTEADRRSEVIVIDAARSIDSIQADIRREAERRLGLDEDQT
jgi:dTMP kinase